jgi:hypothetical protein
MTEWRTWWITGWILILAALFIYELIAVLDKNPHTPSLTQVVVHYVPGWITLPFLLWLFLHFAIRYWRLK